MGFTEELRNNQIDPDKFVAFQSAYIRHSREQLDSMKDKLTYREYLEQDQFLTMMEKFITRMERERLQERMNELSDPTSSL